MNAWIIRKDWRVEIGIRKRMLTDRRTKREMEKEREEEKIWRNKGKKKKKKTKK